jgi:hypothetical protein
MCDPSTQIAHSAADLVRHIVAAPIQTEGEETKAVELIFFGI